MANTEKFAPKKILVISMRHIGDAILATPVTRSLRSAYPTAQLDILTYGNTAAVLEGNPDIDDIICTSQKPKLIELIKLFIRIFREYDLCAVTQTGDRPAVYAFFAAPFRIGEVPGRSESGWWKRYLFQRWTEFDDINTHTVIQHMRLIDLLGIPRKYDLVPPKPHTSTAPKLLAGCHSYAVLHVFPLWTYKRWSLDNWNETAQYLSALGITVVLTGSPNKMEQQYIASLAEKMPKGTINLAGKTSLAQLSEVISNATLYIGPDTGTTHLAAATGVPVIAIFGPTNPVKWAPWPHSYSKDQNPFHKVGNQNINNIHLIQGQGDCVPCHLEGCDRHRQSHSLCLDQLSSQQVKQEISQILKKNNEITLNVTALS